MSLRTSTDSASQTASSLRWKKKFMDRELPPLFGHKCVALSDGRIAMLGGFRVAGSVTQSNLEFFVVDPATGDVEDRGYETARNRVPCLQGMSVVRDRSQLIVFGGRRPDQTTMSSMYSYDLETREWDEIEPRAELGAVKPPAISHHSAIVWSAMESRQRGVNFPYGENVMVIFGGRDQKDKLQNHLYLFDLDEAAWRKVAAHGIAPSPRMTHEVAVSGHLMFVFGGMSGRVHSAELHCLDIERLTWVAVNVKNRTSAVPCAREGHTLLRANESALILYGGLTKSSMVLDDVYALACTTEVEGGDEIAVRWYRIPITKPDRERYMHGACIIDQNLIVYGGVRNDRRIDESLGTLVLQPPREVANGGLTPKDGEIWAILAAKDRRGRETMSERSTPSATSAEHENGVPDPLMAATTMSQSTLTSGSTRSTPRSQRSSRPPRPETVPSAASTPTGTVRAGSSELVVEPGRVLRSPHSSSHSIHSQDSNGSGGMAGSNETLEESIKRPEFRKQLQSRATRLIEGLEKTFGRPDAADVVQGAMRGTIKNLVASVDKIMLIRRVEDDLDVVRDIRKLMHRGTDVLGKARQHGF